MYFSDAQSGSEIKLISLPYFFLFASDHVLTNNAGMNNAQNQYNSPQSERLSYSANSETAPRGTSKEMAFIGVLISLLYLANLTFGIIEVPDNLPIIGNIDEVFFSGVLFASLSQLGIKLPGYKAK
jgi:hypothetical protein